MPAATHDIPGTYVAQIAALAARWNVSTDRLLDGLGIDADSLAEPETRIRLDVCETIATRAYELTGEPALALYFGWQMRLSWHGFLGFAAMTAPTARGALDLAVQYAATRTTALGLSVYVEGDTASLVVEERAALGRLRELAVLGVIVGIWQLGEMLTGRRLPGTADCALAVPAYWERVPFGTERVRFGQPANRLVFPVSVLDMPLHTADAAAMRLARLQCERELAAVVDAGFTSRVRAVIDARVDAIPPIGEVARALHVSERTLKRKLADRDTTYTRIVEDVRRQRAMLLLDNRNLSIGEVADRLGYSNLANFTRAFRKWTGVTPAAYRQPKPG